MDWIKCSSVPESACIKSAKIVSGMDNHILCEYREKLQSSFCIVLIFFILSHEMEFQ